jgi:RND family efflux transporter MFP subunit
MSIFQTAVSGDSRFVKSLLKGISGGIALIFFIITVVLAAEEDGLTVSGLTEPVYDVILSFEVDGKITGLHFKEGDFVKKGTTIAVLNKWFEELEVKRNRLIWESKAEVESAFERKKTIKSLFDSTRALYERTGSVSRDELDKLELEYKLAAAEVKQLEVSEKREQIEYDMARAKLAKMVLKSPNPGVITELFLQEGESCESRQPVLRVVDTSRCYLVCNIEAFQGANLKKDQAVDLKIRVGPGLVDKKGRVVFVSQVVDPASGLYRVKVEFENDDHQVKPGVEGTMVLPLS